MGIGEMGGVLGDEGVVTSDGIAWNGRGGEGMRKRKKRVRKRKKRRKRRRKRRRVIRDTFFI